VISASRVIKEQVFSVSSSRIIILLAGPVALVGSLYWLTMPVVGEGPVTVPPAKPLVSPPAGDFGPDQKILAAACRRKALELKPKLSASCRLIIRVPYVLAGDLGTQELERLYRETIQPTAQALATCYFDQSPNEPIVILMFASASSYQDHALRFDGRKRANYHGYYERGDRRIVLNISTGNGTLAHELTHALGQFDFPEMPEWFDEGLGSLHEQSRFSDDGLRLIGESNWRLNYLLPALRNGRLGSLETLMTGGGIRKQHEAVQYAQTRYFLLYLQQRHLLGSFYRKFRAHVAHDPTGIGTLRDLLHSDSLANLDRDFRRWVLTQESPKR